MNVRAFYQHAWLGVLLGLAAPLPAWTQVTVIYDSGQTRPLAPYLEVLGEGAPEPAPPVPPGFRFGAGDVRNLLPIRSPGLTPGKVSARAHSRPLSRPVFLIGSDARSRQWLARHRARLEAIGAVGLLVQARTMDDLRAVSALAAGLPVMPASGSDLACALGLDALPGTHHLPRHRAVSAHPVEALLRPPVELWSALAAFAAAVIAVCAPWALMMPPGVAWGAAAGLFLVGGARTRQAWRVIRYQRNLRRLPAWTLHAERVPVSPRKLFLGRGFRWTPLHTQRLRDTLRPEVRHYLQPGVLYRWARRREIAWELMGLRGRVTGVLRARAWWNPLAPLPPVGGNPALHAVEPCEQNAWMDLGERVGHMLVLGTTRVGKTRLAELLIAQDIRRGDVVIVFDPKGDAGLLRRVYSEARRAGRTGEFHMFHLGYPGISARYNAIGSFSRITEVATRIANQLPNEGNSAAFKEFAWRFVNIIARALVALGRRPDYQQVRRYINDIEPLFVEYAEDCLQRLDTQDWRGRISGIAAGIKERNLPASLRGRSAEAIALMRYLNECDLYDPVLDGLVSAFKYDRTYFDKIVSSVGPLMEKLTTGKIAELISPDYLDEADPRPIFEWMQVIRRRGIVYVGLDALSDTTVASAVGNSMFADLVSVAGHLYKHGLQDIAATAPPAAPDTFPTISMHADEFNELIGDEFVPLLNKAGGAGFQVTAYTQTWSDVEARLGNRAKAGQVAGNFNTLIMLRVKELATAEMLTGQLPRVEVFSLMSVSGVDDSSDPASGIDFKSRNEDRISVSEVPMLTPAELMTLPKGQAFALLEGGQLWKLRMPLPDTGADRFMPQSLAEIASEMERTYITGNQWYRAREPWEPVTAATPPGANG